jgi:tRNA A-37 threonylcarbamoyl transferase component Bud32
VALYPGTKLGPYEILSAVGAGGMGEVYRARDARLGRDVAVKVLPEAVANDAQRLARFQREAQVLASLNHPNIASIYGLEESGKVRALVMELVDGPTLAERIAQGPVPLDEALPLARQIAEGLEYAHEKGIVHRDLKPANIKVTPEGGAKILDFGLAKAFSLQDSAVGLNQLNSPTISLAATQAGMVLGTAAYMSPEQARGKPVDRRADIWAFGCVLYEMLTGKRALEGETSSDVLAAVIRAEPDWNALPGNAPARIRELVRRCLVKDSKQRLQSIGDARIAIEEALTGEGVVGVSPVQDLAGAQASEGVRRAPLRSLPWLVAAGLMVIAGIAAGWWVGARRSPPSPTWSAQMLGGPSVAMGARISPDGHTLAFQAMMDGLTQVAVMDADSGDWTVLTKNRSRGYVTEVNWSPDGSQVYFDRDLSVPNGIYTVSRFGGNERLILEDAVGPEVLPDGSLLVVRTNKDRAYQLYHFWPESGRLEALDAFFDAEMDLCPSVRVFHDGKEAVFFAKTHEQNAADPLPHLYVLDVTSGKTRRLAPELDLHPPSSLGLFPIAVARDDKSVLVDLKAGNLHRVVSIPRNGSGAVRSLLSLTLSPWFMDEDKDGNLYLEQADRPIEVLRSAASGGTPELLAGSEAAYHGGLVTLQFPDGRVVLISEVAGRSRLLAARPGGEATPLIETKEETSGPACQVGEGEVAFLLGVHGSAVVAVASIADGRILRRLSEIPGGEVTGLAASPEGKTLYYVASRAVWAIPVTGGQPRRIGPGDAVAADPNGKDLIVQLVEKEGIRLVRVAVSGGAEQPIPFQGPLRLAPVPTGPNAIGKDGRVVLSVAMADSWFYGIGILDPRSGKLGRVPLNFTGDLLVPAWLDDGRILTSGWPLKATLWRFHPAAGRGE